MRKVTGRNIEKRAVMEFICYFEEKMNMVIEQSVKELKKKNGLEGIQGLRPQERIDRGCIRKAIKSINNNGHSSMPGRAGGKKPKEKQDERHTQEGTEVV